jgi:hypothetical protein
MQQDFLPMNFDKINMQKTKYMDLHQFHNYSLLKRAREMNIFTFFRINNIQLNPHFWEKHYHLS